MWAIIDSDRDFASICVPTVYLVIVIAFVSLLESGERGRNRTFNLVIKSHLLCQLSYAPYQ